MTEWSSLSVKASTRDRFNEEREAYNEAQDGGVPDLSQDQFLKMLLDTLKHAQEGGYNENPETREVFEAVDSRLDALEYDAASSGEVVGFDDVKTACRRALREELPEEAFR